MAYEFTPAKKHYGEFEAVKKIGMPERRDLLRTESLGITRVLWTQYSAAFYRGLKILPTEPFGVLMSA